MSLTSLQHIKGLMAKPKIWPPPLLVISTSMHAVYHAYYIYGWNVTRAALTTCSDHRVFIGQQIYHCCAASNPLVIVICFALGTHHPVKQQKTWREIYGELGSWILQWWKYKFKILLINNGLAWASGPPMGGNRWRRRSLVRWLLVGLDTNNHTTAYSNNFLSLDGGPDAQANNGPTAARIHQTNTKKLDLHFAVFV